MQRPQIDQLLPGMFQRAAGPGTVVAATLDVMAELHEADEAILADIDAIFDPYRTPDRFVPFLARWVDLDRLLPPDTSGGDHVPFAPGYGCLRNLVATGAELAQWRGTSAGLRWFLHLATGVDGFTIVEDVPGRPFHIEVHVPPDARGFLELIERIVTMDKPAFVTATVVSAPGAEPAATDQPDPSSGRGPEETAAAHADPAIDPLDLPTVAVPVVPTLPTAGVPLIDLPTDAVPVADPADAPRWTGAGTESASIPVPASPDGPLPSEGATP